MDAEQRRRVGRIIRLGRAEAGMSQQDLAASLGVARPTISEWERGGKAAFTRADAVAIEQALGIADRRLLITLGYEQPSPTAGWILTAAQRQEVDQFVQWLHFRDRR